MYQFLPLHNLVTLHSLIYSVLNYCIEHRTNTYNSHSGLRGAFPSSCSVSKIFGNRSDAKNRKTTQPLHTVVDQMTVLKASPEWDWVRKKRDSGEPRKNGPTKRCRNQSKRRKRSVHVCAFVIVVAERGITQTRRRIIKKRLRR